MTSVCRTRFRVWPLDLDLNMHVNNGVYLSLMDLGRFDLLLRAGMFWSSLRKGYYPVVASESIRFKRSLEPFESFEIHTQMDSWSDKDFFISQKFVRGHEIVAEGYIKGRFKHRSKKGSVTIEELFRDLGEPALPAKDLSEVAKLQVEIEKRLAR